MTDTKYSWVSHLEWLVMMVTIISGFYTIDAKIDRQSVRTDRLYEMFCDMQKQLKDEVVSLNKSQLEFIKENSK